MFEFKAIDSSNQIAANAKTFSLISKAITQE